MALPARDICTTKLQRNFETGICTSVSKKNNIFKWNILEVAAEVCIPCCASRRSGKTEPISYVVDLTGRLLRRVDSFRETNTNNNNNNIGYYYVTEANIISLRRHERGHIIER